MVSVRQPRPRGPDGPGGASPLLTDEARSATARIDLRGALTVVPGLFALVYGLSKAETDGWGSATTLGFLAVGLALLVAFAAFERRVPHAAAAADRVDRNRGGSYLAVGIVGVGLMGGLFLLTFYLQQTLRLLARDDRLHVPAVARGNHGELDLVLDAAPAAHGAEAIDRDGCCLPLRGWWSSPSSAFTLPTPRTCCPGSSSSASAWAW